MKRWVHFFNEHGFSWTLFHFLRKIWLFPLNLIDVILLKIEREKLLHGPYSYTAQFNTQRDNYLRWNAADWNEAGDEWTDDVRIFKGEDPKVWKEKLLNNYLLPHLDETKNVLEVGPGGGRWTEVIKDKSKNLHLFDISDTAINKCKKLFENDQNIHYHLIPENSETYISSQELPDNSIDFIWSYDVFIHINPVDIDRYLRDFKRVMKKGALAILHHAGDYSLATRRRWFRSNMDANAFARMSKKHSFQIKSQNFSDAHFPGDVITILELE